MNGLLASDGAWASRGMTKLTRTTRTEYGGTGSKTKVSTGYAYFPGQGDVYDYPDPIIPWYESQYMTVPADFNVPYENDFAE